MLDLITPYRRVCGALLLLWIAAVGPNLAFFTSAVASERIRVVAPIIALGLFALSIALPPVRRVTPFTSWVVLVVSGTLILGIRGCDTEIKNLLAEASGMYDASPPWLSATRTGPSQDFTHPLASYSLRVPSTWQAHPGPTEHHVEFVRHQGEQVAAVLRPGCNVSDAPLATTVIALEERRPDTRRVCSKSQGLDACLLRRPQSEGKTEEWDWLAQRPGSQRSIWLKFVIYDPQAISEAYAILASARAAQEAGPLLPCGIPAEWATPFDDQKEGPLTTQAP